MAKWLITELAKGVPSERTHGDEGRAQDQHQHKIPTTHCHWHSRGSGPSCQVFSIPHPMTQYKPITSVDNVESLELTSLVLTSTTSPPPV